MQANRIENERPERVLLAWSWTPFSINGRYRLANFLPPRQGHLRGGPKRRLHTSHLLNQGFEKVDIGERLEYHQLRYQLH